MAARKPVDSLPHRADIDPSRELPRSSISSEAPRDLEHPLINPTSPRRKPVPIARTASIPTSATKEKHEPPVCCQKSKRRSWQLPQLPRWLTVIRNRANEWSVWEIIGLAGSALLLLAIVIILNQHDNKRLQTWKNVSLNTVISWLSTVSRLLVLIPLSTSIGQLKWIWIASKKRQLADLAVFESASRGMLGSLSLLWMSKARHISTLGAIAVILAVGFDPFNQLLIDYYDQNIEDASQFTYLANASFYDTAGPNFEDNVYQVDPILKGNVYSSMFDPNSQGSWKTPQYACSTGNCTWDPIYSLEARSLCSNISSHTNKSCGWWSYSQSVVCNLTVPDGGASMWYETSDGSSQSGRPQNGQMMILTKPSHPIIYKDSSMLNTTRQTPSVMVLQWISLLGLDSSKGSRMTHVITNDTKWTATECSLELYVRKFNASVQNSIYQDTTLDSWSDITWTYFKDVQAEVPETDDQIYWTFVVPAGKQKDEYFIGRTGYMAMQWGLFSYFNGTVSAIGDGLSFSQPGTITSDILQTLLIQNFANCPTPDDRLSCLMSNVAAAMSKTLRDSAVSKAAETGFNASSLNAQNSANMTVGQTFISVVFVRVRWRWISLPVLVWVLTALTWISTAFLTRKANLQKWGNDILPLLFLYDEGCATQVRARSEDGEEEVVGEQGFSSAAVAIRAQGLQAQLFVDGVEAKLI